LADQYGLSKTQLFTWRRDAQGGGAEQPQEPIFAPVVLEGRAEAAAAPRGEPKPKKARRGSSGGIGLEIDGMVVRVERGTEARTMAAVVQALKRTR
jgi:transposase